MHPVRFARRRPKLAVLLVVVLALVLTGVALAIWNFTGSTNQAEGKTGTPSVTFSAPTAAELNTLTQCFPGSSCDLAVDVTNPMSTPVSVISYQPTNLNGFSVGGSCTASLTGPAQGNTLVTLGTPVTVPASATNFKVVLPNAITLPATAGTNCQTQLITEAAGTITVNMTVGS